MKHLSFIFLSPFSAAVVVLPVRASTLLIKQQFKHRARCAHMLFKQHSQKGTIYGRDLILMELDFYREED